MIQQTARALFSVAKDKWEKSGIIKEGDIYKVVATEFGLGFFDFPPTPWWEDENLI